MTRVAPLEWAEIDGLCGDRTCRVRVHVRLWTPTDPLALPPCWRCAEAADAALRGPGGARLRAMSLESR